MVDKPCFLESSLSLWFHENVEEWDVHILEYLYKAGISIAN